MNWIETENYLKMLSNRGIHPGLERMRKLMKQLGNPERNFKAIHVAGTNGKGSVCAMIESILRCSDYRTGLYTSPHLMDIRERIRCCGNKIPPESFINLATKVRVHSEKHKINLTYFEFLTAIAFCYFAEKKIDCAVVEVGLGGRLDATNILPYPEIVVITNIDLEHTNYLGKTIDAIAGEKGGIIKKNGICVTGAEGSALKEISGICQSCQVKMFSVSSQSLNSEQMKLFNNCGLKGGYQLKNFRIVLKIIDELKGKGWNISKKSVIRGFRKVVWRGRFEFVKFKIKNQKIPLLLDGAHNPAAVRELICSVYESNLRNKNCMLIFNALKDKNILQMTNALMKGLRVKKVMIPDLNSKRALSAETVKNIFRKFSGKIEVQTFRSVKDMLNFLNGSFKKKSFDWILATGSFYLVSGLLSEWSNHKEKTIKISES